MPITKVGKISLKNSGGFVAKMQLAYINDDGEKVYTGKSGDVTLGFTKEVDPGDMGVPTGSNIYLKAIVVAGFDKEANKMFVYEKGNTTVAKFMISGTTLSNDMGFLGTE
ncbi:MAG: hypothetical protein R2792_11890 [Saprospiraceae bacterium]|jgi:hypothetical protein